MNLLELIDGLPKLSDDECIFARKPWSATSEAITTLLGDDFRAPPNLAEVGLEYFLEVHVAKDVLEVLGDRPVTVEEHLNLLIFYAENDAYPDWVYV